MFEMYSIRDILMSEGLVEKLPVQEDTSSHSVLLP